MVPGLQAPLSPQADRFPIRLALGAIVALAFVYRAFLIARFPTIYSWDAFTRLLDPSRLLVRHWMPIPQVPIYLADLIGADIVFVRLAYAGLGTAAIALLGAFVVRTQGPRAALIATGTTALLPGLVVFTIVPYQEGVFLFLVFLFLSLWKQDGDEMSRLARGGAAAALGLACLCRYEAWILAALFAARPLVARRWADLRPFAPAVFAILWWLSILPTLDQSNPMATPIAPKPARDLAVGFAAAAKVARLGAEGMQWIGLPLALLGAHRLLRRGGLLGREILVFSLALFGLTLLRALLSTQATGRMTVLPLVFAALYLPEGLRALASSLPTPPRIRSIAEACVVVALLTSLGITGYESLNRIKGHYRDEASVARHLQEVIAKAPPQVRIGIVPRQIENVWGENSIKAIFGQAMSLRIDDPRWSIGLDRVLAERRTLDGVLLYDEDVDRYKMVSPNDPTLKARYSTR